MNEKEKMIQGLAYAAWDAQLVADRIRAKQLCHQYNALAYVDESKQAEIRISLLGNQKEGCHLEAPFFCDYGYNIQVGSNFYTNHNCVMLDCAPIVFGDQVMIGPNCGFYTAGHPIDKDERKTGLEFAKPIHVGNDVWIGGNVCVMPGVHIGDNVVIGAGSVVTKDIPSNVIALGNPCKVVKTLDNK